MSDKRKTIEQVLMIGGNLGEWFVTVDTTEGLPATWHDNQFNQGYVLSEKGGALLHIEPRRTHTFHIYRVVKP